MNYESLNSRNQMRAISSRYQNKSTSLNAYDLSGDKLEEISEEEKINEQDSCKEDKENYLVFIASMIEKYKAQLLSN